MAEFQVAPLNRLVEDKFENAKSKLAIEQEKRLLYVQMFLLFLLKPWRAEATCEAGKEILRLS